MILNTFGRASNKQIMPGYLAPVMLEVAVVLKMSEIYGFIIINRCLILYLIFMFTFTKSISVVAIFNLMTIWLLKNYKK